MFSVRIEGLDALRAQLDEIGKQTRFAASVALTRTATAVARAERGEVERVFDKPTPWVRRGFGWNRATPRDLVSEVFIRPEQSKVLTPHIVGGRRDRKRFEERLGRDAANADGFWLPGAGVKLNAAGNLTRAEITRIADGLRKSGKYADVFIGVPRGHAGAPFGIWARPKRGNSKGVLKPLLIRASSAPTYRKRFDFYGVAVRTVERVFAAEFERAKAEAIRTAR